MATLDGLTRRLLLVGLLGLASIAACSLQAPAAAAARICTPGNYVFCRCKDRSEATSSTSASAA